MKLRLIALRPILFGCRQYEVGDTLPTDDKALVIAWVAAGSAAWESEPDEADKTSTKKRKAKAKMATAQPGLPGKATDAEGDALVGRVPVKRGKGAV